MVQLIDEAVLVGRITLLDNLVIVYDMFIKLVPQRLCSWPEARHAF